VVFSNFEESDFREVISDKRKAVVYMDISFKKFVFAWTETEE
jgi:hypothetical protein